MKALDQRTAAAVPLHVDELRQAAERFAALFSSLTGENLPERVAAVYARDAYLNDNLKEVEGLKAITHYLQESGDAVVSCKVSLEDMAVSGDNCYVRWTMDIVFKKLKKGQLCRSFGMSHLLFNSEGKILYHRDYWDSTAGLFEHIPIVGGLIRMIKKRI